ncbi:hypothetical protein AAE02nite_04880 [Adhaeribacter aerolatus]|uniref:Uncharacterized protein n=1 Tax=Adhaeribacter aerolatus TaxID=670289 RepID=A0A512ASZ1_9BACT|nr:hypothetical protein [Adhaeribacter aerolatus]GEO02824.1 hypothetical protein AAE02nite_04880 [Adhaeribacter aerolatus]
MGKKILLFILAGVLVVGLVKIFFFSGITQKTPPPSFRKAAEPGFVWASAGAQYARGRLGEFLLGQHYRDVWTTPVKAPVLNLAQLNGGMRVGKLGGGQQTTSLSLIAPNGQTWVIRSLDKDPVNILPPFWRRTIFADLLHDQISASHPYAALVVGKLADAAGIFHTNPQVVFVPAADARLQPYKARLGNKLFLLEEKYGDSAQVWPQLKGASELVDSRVMLDRRFQNQKHRIDEKAFARCRLFDLYIGDWDRHEGQWTWAAYPADSTVLYKPIPKDRDQAFSLYQDGLVPWLLTRDFALPKFGHFDYQVADVSSYTVNASFIDERALTEVTLPEFKALAQQLQVQLSDSVIETSVKLLPTSVYMLTGAELMNKLKSRRENLVQVATEYYRVLASHVIIPGTDQREKFEIKRLPNGRVLVKVYGLTDAGAIRDLYYSRIFTNRETIEITLHGLAGADIFEVRGKAEQSIKINIVGGLGEDTIADYGQVGPGKKLTVVFDTRDGNDITWGPGTENKTTNELSVHHFDREGL